MPLPFANQLKSSYDVQASFVFDLYIMLYFYWLNKILITHYMLYVSPCGFNQLY